MCPVRLVTAEPVMPSQYSYRIRPTPAAEATVILATIARIATNETRSQETTPLQRWRLFIGGNPAHTAARRVILDGTQRTNFVSGGLGGVATILRAFFRTRLRMLYK